MKRTVLVLVGVLGIGVVAAAQPAGKPVLIELFTSEGCSSCPPADELLRRLITTQPVENVEIIGLSEHVDYWDSLGWRDPFSSARFTERQNDYAEALGDPEKVYTPQMVVNGSVQVLGSNVDAIREALATAAQGPHVPLAITAKRGTGGSTASISVEVGEVPAELRRGKIRVVVAIVEDGLKSSVRRGENANKTIEHDAVVRAMETVGVMKDGALGATAKEIGLKEEWASGKLRAVAFLQDEKSRRVLGAATGPLG